MAKHLTDRQKKKMIADYAELGSYRAVARKHMFNYNSEKWKRKRKSILARDSYKCQICKRYGKAREATEVHHIKHVDEYPELAYVDSNLVSLCRACHNKQHPEKGGRVGIYLDNSRG